MRTHTRTCFIRIEIGKEAAVGFICSQTELVPYFMVAFIAEHFKHFDSVKIGGHSFILIDAKDHVHGPFYFYPRETITELILCFFDWGVWEDSGRNICFENLIYFLKFELKSYPQPS